MGSIKQVETKAGAGASTPKNPKEPSPTEQKLESSKEERIENESEKPKKDDSYYFDSYGHFGIHEEMLQDKVRTQTYRNAILQNRQLFAGKTVLDIGCGTGILCLFAASAGAKKVYGIECASIAKGAKQIVKDNNMDHVIEIIHGKVEEVELPVDKVDVIISEWMGYFLLYESMLDTVIYARDKWLKPDGVLIPDKGKMLICGLEDADYKDEKVHFWDNVYNYDMSCMKEQVLNEPLVDIVESNKVVTEMVNMFELDLYTIKTEDLDFEVKLDLPVLRNDYCHALVAFFEVEFSKCHRRQRFSTGPHCKPTHWKQTVFYLTEDLMVSKNTTLNVDISVKKNAHNHRDLNIGIKVRYKGPYGDSVQNRNYIMK